MKKIFLFFVCAALLGLSGFSRAEELSFKKTLKKYHRHGEKYNWDTLHENIHWDVIHKTDEFRRAYEREYAKYYKLSPEELNTRTVQSLEEGEKGPEFLVILSTYSRKWNDLDSKDSIWRLRLENGGETYEPVSISLLKTNPIDATFYPYIYPWSKVYSVLFPKGAVTSSSSDYKLTLFGVKGQQTLHWEYK
ncbi:MAG: hypothetical protein U1F57_11975 [bacterium]